MTLRSIAGGFLALQVPACAGGPKAGIDPPVVACGKLMATGAAFVEQLMAAREEKLKGIRFATEQAMYAYNEAPDTFTTLSIDLAAMRNVLEKEYGLPDDIETCTFDHTTDDEATARIDAAKACAVPLIP